eukprot:13305990-Ditylum_brightwellii.AAC.1
MAVTNNSNNNSQRRCGRGGCGGGCGGHGFQPVANVTPPATQWQQPMPMQQMPMPPPPGMPAYNAQGQALSYRKRFNNMNYCWTHGCDVHDWHTSATCPNPWHGHLLHATWNNMMGGNTKGSHK